MVAKEKKTDVIPTMTGALLSSGGRLGRIIVATDAEDKREIPEKKLECREAMHK